MRTWLLLSLALLGCSEDPDVVVYVVTSEGGSSSIGGASEAQEAALSAGGKSVDASYTVATAAGGSSQMSSSQGGSSAVERSSIGGSSTQTSQTSHALTVSFGGSSQIATSVPVAVGGSTHASTESTPEAPPQDCRSPYQSHGLCGPDTLGSMVCDSSGKCVSIDVGEKKLDCDYNGIPETPVDDSNCAECGHPCLYGTKCILGDRTGSDGNTSQSWTCALPTK